MILNNNKEEEERSKSKSKKMAERENANELVRDKCLPLHGPTGCAHDEKRFQRAGTNQRTNQRTNQPTL